MMIHSPEVSNRIKTSVDKESVDFQRGPMHERKMNEVRKGLNDDVSFLEL